MLNTGNVDNSEVARFSTASAGPLFAQQDAVWNGGLGNWNNAGNWLQLTVPDNNGTTFNVLIDNGVSGTNSDVTLDISATIDSLTIDDGDILRIGANTFTLTTGSNGGTIVLNGGTLQGGVLASTHTIDGRGTISLDLDNAGVINSNLFSASFGGQVLTIDSTNVSNSSMLKATNGGILSITSSLRLDSLTKRFKIYLGCSVGVLGERCELFSRQTNRNQLTLFFHRAVIGR